MQNLLTDDCIRPPGEQPPKLRDNSPPPLAPPNPDQAAADAVHYFMVKEDAPPYGTDKADKGPDKPGQ